MSSLELSPGFFSLNNPLRYQDEDEEEDLVLPVAPHIENTKKENIAVKIINLLIFTPKPCGCNNEGWTRTHKY